MPFDRDWEPHNPLDLTREARSGPLRSKRQAKRQAGARNHKCLPNIGLVRVARVFLAPSFPGPGIDSAPGPGGPNATRGRSKVDEDEGGGGKPYDALFLVELRKRTHGVAPGRYAVVAACQGNYGHPSEYMLEVYRDQGVAQYAWVRAVLCRPEVA